MPRISSRSIDRREGTGFAVTVLVVIAIIAAETHGLQPWEEPRLRRERVPTGESGAWIFYRFSRSQRSIALRINCPETGTQLVSMAVGN